MQSLHDLAPWIVEQVRFRPRQIILAGVVANTLLAVLFYGLIRLGGPAFNAELLSSYPSDVIKVRNLSGSPYSVRLVLDGRYERTAVLPPGISSFEVRHGFGDRDFAPPPDGFKPRMLEIRGSGWSEVVEIKAGKR